MINKKFLLSLALSSVACFSTIAFATQQPFYRGFSSSSIDHFYTTSLTEIINAGSLGYQYEGIAGNLVTANDALSSGPLYRAYSHSQRDHFYTASYPEFINAISLYGYTNEGVAGYMVNSGVEFRRSYNGSDHFYTKDYNEWINSAVNLGYALEGSAGLIL